MGGPEAVEADDAWGWQHRREAIIDEEEAFWSILGQCICFCGVD